MSFVTHLECAACGKHYDAEKINGLCEDCSRPLWVRYDLPGIAAQGSRDALKGRPPTLWRYTELLPLRSAAAAVSLGETMTPLIPAPRLGAELGLRDLWIKDESRLPTGSFKARGMAMAVSRAKELGVQSLAVPTAGNAGGALAAYAARAGLPATVFMPQDTPRINRQEVGLFGADSFVIDGLIDDCGRLVRERRAETGWFDVSTLKEPYRIEGKKTMGLELAEQFEWSLPDAIFYPTGGGTGLIGMWKAFAELGALGWLDSEHRPRMFSCQSTGCAPIVEAFQAGKRYAERADGAQTAAAGIRVPMAVGDFMILDAVRESGGMAVAEDEESIQPWMSRAASTEGISLCPETAICLGALARLVADGTVSPSERVVVFNTGAAQKYVELLPDNAQRMEPGVAPS